MAVNTMLLDRRTQDCKVFYFPKINIDIQNNPKQHPTGFSMTSSSQNFKRKVKAQNKPCRFENKTKEKDLPNEILKHIIKPA